MGGLFTPIIDKNDKIMKKVFLGLAIVLTMVLAYACGTRGQKAVEVEEEVTEVADTTLVEAPADSLAVVAE